MAEGLLRFRAHSTGVEANVSSAGLYPGGAPATEHAVSVLADRGIDIAGHVSRRLDRTLVDQADLILAMTREHLREAVVTSPTAFAKTFTLREIVRRIVDNPSASLAQLHLGRSLDDYLRPNPEDDVADPVNKPRAEYEKTAMQLDGMLTRLALWLPNLEASTSRAAS